MTRLFSIRNLQLVAWLAVALVFLVAVLLLTAPGMIGGLASSFDDDPNVTPSGRLQIRFYVLVTSSFCFSLLLGAAGWAIDHSITSGWARRIAVGQRPTRWRRKALHGALAVLALIAGFRLPPGLFRDVLQFLSSAVHPGANFVNGPVGKGVVVVAIFVLALIFRAIFDRLASELRRREINVLSLASND
jgi:ABC-type anion transport system duplicated permease subunit